MQITSIIAIYALFWVMSAFFVLPFGVKTHDEAGIAKIPGQADSAPANFNPRRIALRITVVATIAFGLFFLNYTFGWITADSVNFAGGAPNVDGSRS